MGEAVTEGGDMSLIGVGEVRISVPEQSDRWNARIWWSGHGWSRVLLIDTISSIYPHVERGGLEDWQVIARLGFDRDMEWARVGAS